MMSDDALAADCGVRTERESDERRAHRAQSTEHREAHTHMRRLLRVRLKMNENNFQIPDYSRAGRRPSAFAFVSPYQFSDVVKPS